MKKIYEKPEVEIIELEIANEVATGDPDIGVGGTSGFNWPETT